MCDDALMPAVYESRTVVAAKEHRCYECGSVIAKGEKYEYAKGLYDGDWQDYHTCLACEECKALTDEECHGSLSEVGGYDRWESEDAAFACAMFEERERATRLARKDTPR